MKYLSEMIDVRELRVGNLVMVNDKSPHWNRLVGIPVSVIGFQHEKSPIINFRCRHDTYSQFNEYIDPIKLTEGWLVNNFGFEEDCGCYFKTYKNSGGVRQFCVFINDKKFVNELETTDFYFNGTLMGFLKIETVSQLQNLYAILTGEELTLI